MDKVILRAQDLDGYLTNNDKSTIEYMEGRFDKAAIHFVNLEASNVSPLGIQEAQEGLIKLYDDMGFQMQKILNHEKRIHVYCFETPREIHGEVSRLISKLRDVKTEHPEFVYYTQRGYELLFNFAFSSTQRQKNHIIVKTPVNIPVQNFAVHKIPDVDKQIENSVMCVMLRGALLPAMIMSKEIQEYSSNNYVTPFALFKISRNDKKEESNMEYILDLDHSYFKLEDLDGKDLFFADPMNATGGSLVTVVKYLMDQGIKPKSIKFFNTIAALKGAIRIIRALPTAEIYTLWMDPALNTKAYILPGLGDAGDRINGCDNGDHPRDIIQLIADYGTHIVSLYREQVRQIEQTVLKA